MSAKADCYEYVRNYYGVPAYVGVRVTMSGLAGVIVAAKSDLHYVHVRFDGRKHTDNVHPADLRYLAAEGATPPAPKVEPRP